ncbi:nucleolar protein 12-domain-containing protein [Tricladium varicosporioides]|nr:nucleolar protein 12-domain-containing protein [Hymenoscyphus varicosporioides]
MGEPAIFLPPRPKKSVLPPLSRAAKKRKIEHKIEEISFDNDARADYLTGFHKRKVARAKAAQLQAEKMAREEKIKIRKQLREERKQELEEHVEAVNKILKEAAGSDAENGGEEDSWDGIKDDTAIVELVDHEEEYLDEDKYTTVTIEAVDVSKEGLVKIGDESEGEDEAEKRLKSAVTEEKPKKLWPKKVKKKKFRYETKAERKFTRGKQKAGNKAKADARKGND